MKPIRSNELDFFKELISSKFNDKQQSLDTEIHLDAEKLADKKKPLFSKECGIDKELKLLEQADKKYKDFVLSKDQAERVLFDKVRDIANILADKLGRLNKNRDWNEDFSEFNTKEDGVDFFNKRLNNACYTEAKRHVRKGHKLFNVLKDKRDNCKLIVHTGSDIQTTVQTLQAEMGSADIRLSIPEKLLQIAVK